MSTLTPEQQMQVNRIILQAKGVPERPEYSVEEKERLLGRYSVGALVFNFFYFQAMRDSLFMWLSLGLSISIYGLPGLLVLPFFARRRAFAQRSWPGGLGEFQVVQEKWDRAGWLGMVVTLLLGYWIMRSVTSLLLSTMGNSGQLDVQSLQGFTEQIRSL